MLSAVHKKQKRDHCLTDGHCNFNKKLSYCRGTARCVVSVEILPIATQQCRNYLYDKSYTNRSYEVGTVTVGRGAINMCTHSTMTRSSRLHCLIGVINKPTKLWISSVYRRLAVAKFSKSTIYKLHDPDHAHFGNTHSSQD